MSAYKHEEVLLDEYIDTLKGFAFKSQWYSESGVPLVKVSDFSDDSISIDNLIFIPENIAKDFDKYRIQENDIIIQTVGSWPRNPKSVVGKAIRVPHKCNKALLNQNAVKIIPRSNIDGNFLFYLLRSKRFKDYIINTAQGAANQASITLESIRNFKFILPDLETQRKIGIQIRRYDSFIENNSRRIEILEAMAKLIYDEWFVKFKFPGHEDVKMIESDIGMIPQGWSIGSAYDVANILVGFPFKSKAFCEDSSLKPIVRIRDIPNNYTGTYSDEEVDEKYEILSGDMLIGMDGIFHICKWSNTKAYLNQRVARLRPKNGHSKYFMFLSIKPKIERLNEVIVGTTVQHLSQRDFDKMKLLIPPDSLLKEFKEIIDPLYDEEVMLKKQIFNLAKTRDLLLPKLISGELDVSKLDIKLSEVSA